MASRLVNFVTVLLKPDDSYWRRLSFPLKLLRHVIAFSTYQARRSSFMAASALATRAIRGLATMRMSTSSTAARGKATKAAGGCVAVVYISEGKNVAVVDELESTAEQACAKHGARVVNVFRDVEYNRTGFTLGVRVGVGDADAAEPLGAVATTLAEKALSLVDLREHAATHPRCGVVDHISCHAVGDAPPGVAVSLAHGIGAHIGEHLKVPVLLYGGASAKGAALADLRRAHGYFRETAGSGGWSGAHYVDGGSVDPEYGPTAVPPETGIAMVGATPWVCTFNVPIGAVSKRGEQNANGEDAMENAVRAGRRLARKLSERGGGLPGVQAMALPHGTDCCGVIVEIACNLLDEQRSWPQQVQREIERLCAEENDGENEFEWDVRDGYVTNLSPETILERLA